MGWSGRHSDGIISILVIVVVIAFVGPNPAQPEGPVMKLS